MGVLSCSRKDCSNIMCDTYHSFIGYICNDCQREFKQYSIDNQLQLNTENQILNELSKFMKTSKEETYNNTKEITIDEFFSENTRQ